MKIELQLLGIELRDVEKVIQPSQNRLAHRGVGFEWSINSVSHIAEVMMAEFASEDRKNILTRTVDTSVTRIEKGYKLREANFGFENKKVVRNGKEVYIQIPYEPEAKHIRTIFEETIRGMEDKDIAEKINNLGCRTRERNTWAKDKTSIIGRRKGNKVSVKQLQKWRMNPIYCGVNEENWGDTEKRTILVKTDYDGIVTVDVFNKANNGKVFIKINDKNDVKILYNQKEVREIKRKQKFRKDFLFKNVVICDECLKPFKSGIPANGSSKQNKGYYFCDRKHKYIGYEKVVFDEKVNKFLDKIKFQDKYYQILEKTLVYRFRAEVQKVNKGHIDVDERVILLRTNMDEILTAIPKTHSENLRKGLEEKYNKLDSDLSALLDERNNLTITEEDLKEFLQLTKILMERPKEILVNVGSFEQQQAVNKLFFKELPTYTDIVNGTPKMTLFFKTLLENDSDKSLEVTLGGIEPPLQP